MRKKEKGKTKSFLTKKKNIAEKKGEEEPKKKNNKTKSRGCGRKGEKRKEKMTVGSWPHPTLDHCIYSLGLYHCCHRDLSTKCVCLF